MIYLQIFLSFLEIGCFSFGGAYGAIPLIHDVVMENQWLDEAMFTNLVAVSESTPGPIMVNMATYIGSTQAGVLGAAVATLGVVLPSFLIILLITLFLKNLLQKRKVQAVLQGIKPALMGVIFATGFFMLFSEVFGSVKKIRWNGIALFIFALLVIIRSAVQKVLKKEMSPILLIVIAAVLGVILY